MSTNASPGVVVITGGSAGVGRAAARAFAERGWHVGLIARGRQGLEATKREVESLGSAAVIVSADVADPDALECAAQQIEDDLGPIDVWVNNAMATVYGEMKDLAPQEFRRVTDVCYHGQVYGTMAALRRMLPRGRGTIVMIGSALVYRGLPLQSAYCGAQQAVHGMFESLRAELIHHGGDVQAVMVQLPAMNTPMFDWCKTKLDRKPKPPSPIYQPEVAAEAIVFAATEGRTRREIFAGGQTAATVMGNTVPAGVGDNLLARVGYENQLRDEPVEPNRRDNLFEPVERDAGAHGPFDDRSRERSTELWASMNRRWVAAGFGVVGALGLYLATRR
jgi:NAD(P)-dependent dehydrogenase (short-subunit alcohol dehydrogenase family)